MSAGKYPRNGSYYTAADDVEMIATKEDWPPGFLHVKRGHPATEFGVVDDEEGTDRRFVVFLGATRPRLAYENAQAMVADGWRVD